ncbi:Arginase/deacetylase [Dendrothele bispora CBS 962.96]|uniref:Arginase/deacetylase n=1 Tax=Dendrothele bispora (strain CBS 962.96) TaxID=1314807 RepID=A0A4S8MH44_DENBC|nr:Arginase/deacetylase [Dendrothele bispora CBS 962.96]
MYGPQHDLGFSGPLSFSHPKYRGCLEDASMPFDVGIVRFLFELLIWYEIGVLVSGPFAVRSSSQRQISGSGLEPYVQGSNVLDCRDVPLSPYDNSKALGQMEAAYDMLLSQPVPVYSGPDGEEHYREHTKQFALDGKEHPGIVTLGGDYTIKVPPIFRSLDKIYGPISVIHFDTHLDTWPPMGTTVRGSINHGSFFTVAAEEGFLTDMSVMGFDDIRQDSTVGFQVITTDDIDDYGLKKGINPVYLSLDVGVVAGTREIGGWTTRKVERILRALTGLNFVAEQALLKSHPRTTMADITGIAVADIVHDFLLMILLGEPPSAHVGPFEEGEEF